MIFVNFDHKGNRFSLGMKIYRNLTNPFFFFEEKLKPLQNPDIRDPSQRI